jgi:hypothetical protein
MKPNLVGEELRTLKYKHRPRTHKGQNPIYHFIRVVTRKSHVILYVAHETTVHGI